MARVNHKLVKQRLNEKRSKITDRQFFTSRILAGYFEGIAEAQTRRYHYNRRVRLQLYWEPKNKDVALTDNFVIYINAGNKLVTDVRGRIPRYYVVSGLFTHELGHVLYTDFLALQTYRKFFLDSRWYPYPPVYLVGKDALNESDMWTYIKAEERNKVAVFKLLDEIENILEDGYIENRMMSEFPGVLAYGLECVRNEHFAKMDTVTKLKENEESGQGHIFGSLLQVLLSYAKFGEIKYGDEPFSDVRIKTIFDLIPEIDTAVTSKSIKDRMNVANLFLIRCWEYAKEYCELCKAAQDEAGESGGQEDIESTISNGLNSSLFGRSQQGGGNSAPVGGDNAKSDAQVAANREKTKADADSAKAAEASSKNGVAENESENGANESDGTAQAAQQQNGGEGDSENAESKTQSEQSGCVNMGGASGGKQDVQSGEGGRIPLEQTESVYDPPNDGDVEYDDEYQREHYDKAASDIERMLDNMAEKAACEEMENERMLAGSSLYTSSNTDSGALMYCW